MKIKALFFSPTKTTQTIVETIVRSIPDAEIQFDNITHRTRGQRDTELVDQDLLLIGTPVYAGLAPKIMTDYLKTLKGNKTKAVIVSVYGNRSAGQTNRQVHEIITQNGFETIAVAEFVGEHSFSDADYPIAPNRPDADDLKIAEQFGKQIARSFHKRLNPDLIGEKPHNESPELLFDPPMVNENCDNCGICSLLCPVNIIDENKTDCIGCGACVRNCHNKARTFPEKIQQFQVKLNQTCTSRREPKLTYSI